MVIVYQVMLYYNSKIRVRVDNAAMDDGVYFRLYFTSSHCNIGTRDFPN